MNEDHVNLTEEALQAIRDVQKEAIKEWLDNMWLQFGKWSFKGLLSLLFAAFIYALISTHGFGTITVPSHTATP